MFILIYLTMKYKNLTLITLNNTLHIKADNLEPVEVDSSCVDDFRNIAHIEWLNTECSLTFGEYLRRNKFDISELSDRIEVREIYIHKRENLNNFVYRAFLLPEKEDELSELLEIVDKKSYTIEEMKETLRKYIKHVDDCEGTNFISKLNTGESDMKFSESEVKLLQELSNY